MGSVSLAGLQPQSKQEQRSSSAGVAWFIELIRPRRRTEMSLGDRRPRERGAVDQTVMRESQSDTVFSVRVRALA